MLESKFIEGTNNQYSIRNDGVVIRHYRLRKGKIFFKDSLVYGSSKEMMITFFSQTPLQYTISRRVLLKNYFGYFYCKECNCKVYNKSKSSYHCDTCVDINTKESHKTTIRNKRNNILAKKKEYNKKISKELTDSYIINILNMSAKDCTPNIINAQRTKITLIRKLKQLQDGKKETHF